MNRKIAIAPLMFACLMLLAHLAVPHHHHHGTIICLLNYSDEIVAESHCFETHHHDADNNQQDTGSHNNGDDESEENCFMDDLYLLSDSKHTVDIVPVSISDDVVSFPLASVVNPIGLNMLAEVPLRKKPFIIRYKSLLSSDASGLRGPPLC